jgi:hypothetical protein
VGTTVTAAQISADLLIMLTTGGTVGPGASYAPTFGNNVAEFSEATWTNPSSTTIVATGPSTGEPVTITVACVTAASGTIGIATTVAATGPNDWGNAANWSTNTVPTTGDDVYFDDSQVNPVYWGLSQSAVTLNSLNIAATYTGQIGLPLTNSNGTPYPEYRPTYLAIGATTVNIGSGPGQGSQRIKLNFGSVQTAVNINATDVGAEVNLEAVLLLGTNASNTLNVNGNSSVGSAVFGGEVATWLTSTFEGQAAVRFGAGVTWTTLTADTVQVLLNSGGTTLTLNSGQLYFYAGGLTTLTLQGGSCIWNSTGTLTTANVVGAGTLDFSQDLRAKTVTNTIVLDGPQGQILDPNRVVSGLTVQLKGGAQAGQVSWGFTGTLARS